MARELPPLFKSTERVMLDLEKAVRRFPRYHKYNIGARLRDQVFEISALLHRAWRDKDQQLSHVRELVLAVDGLKTTMQVAMRLDAFAGVGEFAKVDTAAMLEHAIVGKPYDGKLLIYAVKP